MMKKIFLYCLLTNTCLVVYAQQGVGINTTNVEASAMLEVKATNKGILPPRIALTSITDVATINSPATGLVVYNTATAGTTPNNVTPGYYFFTGANWLKIGTKGNNAGDMQYWNGKQWVVLPAGLHNQELSICNAVPTWGNCPGNSALPTVITSDIASVEGIITTCIGNVTASGGTTVLARGICYSRVANPTIADSTILDDSSGTGVFVSQTLHMAENTNYHVRAFATNATGTAYGADLPFTTSSVTPPVVRTIQPFGISSTTAYTGVFLVSNGGAPLIATGVDYDFFTPPNQFHINLPGTFTTLDSVPLQLTNLTPNTLYHVRAYGAHNGYTNIAHGTTYSFTTLPAGYFAAIYMFDALKTNSGLTDPSPVPVVTGLDFSACKAVGAGMPSLHSTTNAAFSLTGWTLGATNGSNTFPLEDTASRYFEFTLTPKPGMSLTVSAVKFKWQRSGTGPRQVFVRSSIDNFANNLPASISPANGNLSTVSFNKIQMNDTATEGQNGSTITLSGASYTDITTPVTFRIYGINAEDSNGIFSIDNVVFNGIVN
ncbi:MAG: hypothetical protein V4685_13500 [Bacteroidota bacterium]